MRYLTDADVAELVSVPDAIEVLAHAFRSLAAGHAAMQARLRTSAGGTKLSTLGAVLDEAGILGAKVYATTPDGRFRFQILLFDSDEGVPRALLEGAALTRIRTAAMSALAARHLARPDARVLTVFGAGAQARGHVETFAAQYALEEVRLVHRGDASEVAARLTERSGVTVRQVADPAAAVAAAGLVVTATRARTPLFDGAQLRPGAHLTAVGATRPDAAELDAETVRRAGLVCVEWVEQARREAGDLLQAEAHGAFRWDDAVELADLVAGRHPGRRDADEITLFESVGVGLADVAVAGHALERAAAAGRGMVLA